MCTPGVGPPAPFRALRAVIANTPAFALDVVCRGRGFGGARWSRSSPRLTTTATVASRPNLTLELRSLHTPVTPGPFSSAAGGTMLPDTCSVSHTLPAPQLCPRDQASPPRVPSVESWAGGPVPHLLSFLLPSPPPQ